MLTKLLEILKEKGLPLSIINEGSNEYALYYEDVLNAIETAKSEKVPIIGGDVLTFSNKSKLTYAYQDWGEEYIYLNWSCDRFDNEEEVDYRERSYKTALEKIEQIKEIAKFLKKEFLVALVI